MPQTFETSRRVEFRDTDAAGIVHFSVFFTWMEEAEHELLRSVGLSVFAHDDSAVLTWPRVAVRCEYRGSLRFEQIVRIGVRVARLGTKSITYAFDFVGESGHVADGEVTAVCCRIEGGAIRSVAIPDDVRAKLAVYAVD